MPVNRQHGADVGGNQHGAVSSRKWSPGVLSVSGGVLRTPSPHASTRWLGHRKDMGRFQGWPVLQSWASQADTLPFAFPEALSLSRKYPETSEC